MSDYVPADLDERIRRAEQRLQKLMRQREAIENEARLALDAEYFVSCALAASAQRLSRFGETASLFDQLPEETKRGCFRRLFEVRRGKAETEELRFERYVRVLLDAILRDPSWPDSTSA